MKSFKLAVFTLFFTLNLITFAYANESVAENPNQSPIYFILSLILVGGIIYLMVTKDKKKK